jgi:ABC-type sugar transport system ATPase subunit
VTISDGRIAKASGFSVELPYPVHTSEAVLGFRPEALTEHLREGSALLEMKVDVIEVLGSDQYLYGTCGSDALTARVAPTLQVAVGDRARLGIDNRHLHLFDAATEQAIFEPVDLLAPVSATP